MRRSDQPNWPSATTCFLFFAQDIAHVHGGYYLRRVNVLSQFSIGRFSGNHPLKGIYFRVESAEKLEAQTQEFVDDDLGGSR
jgi:hypothetical protein